MDDSGPLLLSFVLYFLLMRRELNRRPVGCLAHLPVCACRHLIVYLSS